MEEKMNKKIKQIVSIISIIGLVSVNFAGCANKEMPSSSGKNEGEKKSDVVQSILDDNLPELEKYTVNLGYYNCDHMTAACIGKDSGIYEACGLDVVVSGNGKVPQAMAAGQMDAGYVGFQNIARGYLAGTQIAIAANNHTGGSYYLVVANDITDPQQLVGEKLGIGPEPEKGSSWRVMSKNLGIPTEGKNYDGISFDSDQNKYLALKTGQIKGYTACDPWGSMAEYEGTGKILAMDDRISQREGECCVFSLNLDFAEKHTEIAERLVYAHSKSIEFIYTHPLESAKIFAKNYGVPIEVALKTIYKKTVGEGRTIRWDLNNDAITMMLEENISHGDYDPVTVNEIVTYKYYDNSGVADFEEFLKEKVDDVFPLTLSYEEWLKVAKERESNVNIEENAKN